MNLVLSNAFKGILLNSYVNIKFDLAVKSFEKLIDNPSIKTIYDNHWLRYAKQKPSETIKLLKKWNLQTTGRIDVFIKHNDIIKFRNGQAVILCNSVNCPCFIALNPHLKLVYTDDHKFHTFGCFRVSKSHSHSKKINKV